MKKLLSLILLMLPLFTTACNVFGGLSKPSDDNQHLVAARACLDEGDYQCAIDNYNALSSSYNDEKVSEESLTVLAENNIFSISDLVASLGTNLGSATSFSILAVAMEERGITNGTYRNVIKGVYDSDLSITDDAKLAAFSKFIASLAMVNEILANAVGPDGVLTASDFVADPTGCKNTNGTTVTPTAIAACGPPTGTTLTYDSSDPSTWATLGTTGHGDWSGPATIQKLIAAAAETSSEYSVFASGSTNQGLLDTIQTISHYNAGAASAAAEAQVRYQLTSVLGLF